MSVIIILSNSDFQFDFDFFNSNQMLYFCNSVNILAVTRSHILYIYIYKSTDRGATIINVSIGYSSLIHALLGSLPGFTSTVESEKDVSTKSSSFRKHERTFLKSYVNNTFMD